VAIVNKCHQVCFFADQEVPLEGSTGQSTAQVSNTAAELLRQGAACNVIYLGSVDTELLTGPEVKFYYVFYDVGLLMKVNDLRLRDVRSQGGRRFFPVRTFFVQGDGFSRCRRPRFLVQKIRIFFEICGVCPRGQERRG